MDFVLWRIIKCICVIQKLKGGCLIFHLPQLLDKPGFTVIPLLQPQNHKLWNNPRVIQVISQKNIILVLLWKWCYLDLADILMVWINGAPPYSHSNEHTASHFIPRVPETCTQMRKCNLTDFHFHLKPAGSHQGVIYQVRPVGHTWREGAKVR